MAVIKMEYTTVSGGEADMEQYATLLKEMEVLVGKLLEASPVEQYGQVQRAEVIQDLVFASMVELEESQELVFTVPTTQAA